VPSSPPFRPAALKLRTRAGAKRVLAAADVAVPIGAHAIHTEEDLCVALTKLITAHLDVKRWLLKVCAIASIASIATIAPIAPIGPINRFHRSTVVVATHAKTSRRPNRPFVRERRRQRGGRRGRVLRRPNQPLRAAVTPRRRKVAKTEPTARRRRGAQHGVGVSTKREDFGVGANHALARRDRRRRARSGCGWLLPSSRALWLWPAATVVLAPRLLTLIYPCATPAPIYPCATHPCASPSKLDVDLDGLGVAYFDADALGTVRELRKERLAMASLRGGDHRGWHEPDVQARTPHRARSCRACTRPSASFSVVSRLLGRRAGLRLLRFAPAQRATPSFKGGAGGASQHQPTNQPTNQPTESHDDALSVCSPPLPQLLARQKLLAVVRAALPERLVLCGAGATLRDYDAWARRMEGVGAVIEAEPPAAIVGRAQVRPSRGRGRPSSARDRRARETDVRLA
jgi:hypothetical protein